MVLAADVKMLKQRAADGREEDADAQSDADYAECVAAIARATADRAALRRFCAVTACHRTRRCTGEGAAVPVIPLAREREIIDDLYYDMQAQRLAEEA